ncbi:MAG: hypothetical protein ACOYOH_28620 [Paracraurococcus sp.]
MANTTTGPSTAESPYIIPGAAGVRLVSLLSAGEGVAGAKRADGSTWHFAGTPDGIGAFDNGDGTITVLVNHEIAATAGALHDFGATGAFVDRLVIDTRTLAVVSAGELANEMHLFTKAGTYWSISADALARLCSADLAAPGAYYDAATGWGTHARILLNGEEIGPEGRALAWIASGPDAGQVWELPALGRLSFENIVASPNTGHRTIAIGTDDATPGQVYVYQGFKQATGNEIEKAGLAYGELFGIKADFLNEVSNGQLDLGHFSLAPFGNVSGLTGAELQTASDAQGVTSWLRPEDGAWDTLNPNRFYFATTNAIDAPSRLWALDFYDVNHPDWGGTYRMLLAGTEGHKMFDNITVTSDGNLVLLEDVGNNPRAGKIWFYDHVSGKLTEIAAHDTARFGSETAPAVAPFTQDEESSGVLDVTALFPHAAGEKVFLLDTQAHYPFGEAGSAARQEIVEGGQLQLMYVAAGGDWHL